MKNKLFLGLLFLIFGALNAKSQTPFPCNGNDLFGYYISSASSTTTGQELVYSKSRLSKIITATGVRTTICTSAQIDVALNGLGFNPHDNYLYAVSRYDATQFSGKLYRIGSDCQKVVIPVTPATPATGGIVKFSTNNRNTIDAAGGNISSATFDLDNHYYVNTSFTNTSSTGFTNKLQKILINGNSANVLFTKTLTCPSCTTTSKVSVTDIIFNEEDETLYGSNKQTNKLYKINKETAVMTEVGLTGIVDPILGIYKNRNGDIRAIANVGDIYSVIIGTGAFSFLNSSTLNSGNADGASGCYAPPRISGNVFIDANGLLGDNTVNGIGTNVAGATILYANLVQNGMVIKTANLSPSGYYQFLGIFAGNFEVQISSNLGTVGAVPPAQNLPFGYQFVGDHIGIGMGTDGTPNGKLTVTIASGSDRDEVNFGIDGEPSTADVTAPIQANPGSTVQVQVPMLILGDPEEPMINNIIINTLPDAGTMGILYYNGIAATTGQIIPVYNPSLLTFDPVNGSVMMQFTYSTKDMAGLVSNISTVTMPFSTPLPVELISFTGRYYEGKTTLNWSTATENNSDYFSIQKQSKDGAFDELGRVIAKGDAIEVSEYSFTDNNPSEKSYYRLKQVDLDGRSVYSSVIFIKGETKESSFSIRPNIVETSLNIYNEGKIDGGQNFTIFNSAGKALKKGVLNTNDNKIEIANLPAGLYYVVIKVNGQKEKPLKFMKL